ncbi:CBO0543 family protein [Sporomusa aerivorans]|uniref:CBO0543 family protein n=1 Tax=Sporomusa aerivorans TaxID=204936 RepID=UPI00352B606C
MNLVCWGIYVVAAFLWADWRNWRQYYPTYLFMLASNFFASILTFNHTLWAFCPSFPFPNHSVTEFYIVFVTYPAIVLLFLSRYPKDGVIKQFGWGLLWVGAISLSELIGLYFGVISYKNDWSLGWSVVHNIIMFSALLIHHRHNPVWAWILSAIYLLFVWYYFGFNIEHLKYN